MENVIVLLNVKSFWHNRHSSEYTKYEVEFNIYIDMMLTG